MRFFKKRSDWNELNKELKEAKKQLQIAKQKWYNTVILKKDINDDMESLVQKTQKLSMQEE